MTRMRDPYLAGWNAAIEEAARRCWELQEDETADLIRLLTKPDPIDDHWRRVNDGDCGVES